MFLSDRRQRKEFFKEVLCRDDIHGNVKKSMFWSNGAGMLPSVQRKSGDDRLDLWKTDEVAFTLRIMNSLFQFPIHPLLLKTTRYIKWTPCSKVNCVQGYPKPSRENISQTVAFFLHVQGSVFKFFLSRCSYYMIANYNEASFLPFNFIHVKENHFDYIKKPLGGLP